MANIHTHFSCLLGVGTASNAARALEIYNDLAAETAYEDPPSDGFRVSIQPEHGGTRLWLHSDETGDPAHVIACPTLRRRLRPQGPMGLHLGGHLLAAARRRLQRRRPRPRSRDRRNSRLGPHSHLARRHAQGSLPRCLR